MSSRCKGCGHRFPFQDFTADRVLVRTQRGTDHLDNLQLPCDRFNAVKSAMDQAAFAAKLKNTGLSV